MERKGKKALVLGAALLLVGGAGVFTYARYSSTASADAGVDVADWVVSVNGANAVTTDSFTFTGDNIDWDNSTSNAAEGTIAPGSTGTLKVKIDADGSEVPVDYTVTIDQSALTNNNIAISTANGAPVTGTIAYSGTEGDMEKEIQIDITWTDGNSTDANAADVTTSQTEAIAIPVTVTATQHVGS